MIVMARHGYAFQNFDPSKHIRASIREKGISHKHAREVAKAISGLSAEKARDYLLDVINKKRAVPFGRYKGQVGHRSDPGMMAGRYPQKTAKEFLKALDNLEANAGHMGFGSEGLKIVNATVHKGIVAKRIMPRAQGRTTPNNNVMTHIELVGREV